MKVSRETFSWRFRNGPPCLSACLHLMLNLLLLDYYYRRTLFPFLNQLVHIVLGLKSQFLSHENETTSPWQRNYLIKTLQQLRSHISHHCPVLPQLAFVSEMALLWMIACFFARFFSSFCPLSTDLIQQKIGNTSYSHSRNLCCVMWIPGFSLWMQETWHIIWKMSLFTSKVLNSKGEHGWGEESDCVFNFLPEKSCFCIWRKR